MTEKENPLQLRSIIADAGSKSIWEIYRENLKKSFTLDWIFSTWIEKLIVLGSVVWALFSIGRWIWHII